MTRHRLCFSRQQIQQKLQCLREFCWDSAHTGRNGQDLTHTIHVWYIYLHLVDFYGKLVGKYTSHMDSMGELVEPTKMMFPCQLIGLHLDSYLGTNQAGDAKMLAKMGCKAWLKTNYY